MLIAPLFLRVQIGKVVLHRHVVDVGFEQGFHKPRLDMRSRHEYHRVGRQCPLEVGGHVVSLDGQQIFVLEEFGNRQFRLDVVLEIFVLPFLCQADVNLLLGVRAVTPFLEAHFPRRFGQSRFVRVTEAWTGRTASPDYHIFLLIKRYRIVSDGPEMNSTTKT